MRSLVVGAALLALAACPKKQDTTATPQAGAGCPAASGVYVASFIPPGGKGPTCWVMPIGSMVVEGNQQFPDITVKAGGAGTPAAPSGTLWLVTGSGQPCRASIGNYYRSNMDGPPASITDGYQLEGCAPPANPEDGGGIVLASDAPPTGCRFEAPQPVAARLGEMDAQKQWQRPTKETPIPPALAAIIPPHECAAPGCETLWAFADVKVNGKTVAWSGAVNWLAVGDPAQQCSWPAERFSGFFVPGPDGTAVKVTEGQDKPLVLSAVLVDGSGPKVLLAEGPGTYATYDLAAGGAKLARNVTYIRVPPDAWEAVDHIGPICDAR